MASGWMWTICLLRVCAWPVRRPALMSVELGIAHGYQPGAGLQYGLQWLRRCDPSPDCSDVYP
ncbi:MAG: hypothetical protein Kow0063_20490 [Anaerolineae bacterium]